jgi:putative sigma-54 modulation protein
MKIEIRGSTVPISEALEEHILRKLDFALRRFADRLDRVVVRLVDLNGPKGGIDKRCRIAARLMSPVPSVIVEATDADAYMAVSQAAARLEERVARTLSKQRDRADPSRHALRQ